MGVSGLYSLIRDNRSACVETVDLVAECKSAPGKEVEIIVDYCAMRDELWRNISVVFMGAPYNNPYLTLPTGDYELIYRIVKHVLLQLKAIGLKLTIVYDCLKMSSDEEKHVKHSMWLKKLGEYLAEQRKMLSNLHTPLLNFQDYGRGVTKLPWFGALLKSIIQEMGFECHAPHGKEMDFYRVELRRQRNAFAVLGNDTDYVLFPDCPVILWQMFDEGKHISYRLNEASVAPVKLVCGRVVASRVWKFLRLANHNQFIDVTSVLGNLFTVPHVNGIEFLKSLRFPRAPSKFHSVASFIMKQRNYNGIENCPLVAARVEQGNYGFREAFQKARDYFSLVEDPLQLDANKYAHDPVLAFLALPETMIRLGDWPSRIHSRSQWAMALLEDQSLVSYQEALNPWLARLFAFVHKNPEEASVHVYYRQRGSILVGNVLVQPVKSGDGSTVEEIMPENTEVNLKRFVEIMTYYSRNRGDNSHQDKLSEFLNPSAFTQAFLGYAWRLLLHVEPQRGYFTATNFKALTTSLLTLVDAKARQQIAPLLDRVYALRFTPNPAHITIFNWLQVICLSELDLCQLLYLDNFLDPVLPQMFSFSLFMAYVNVKDPHLWPNPELRAELEKIFDDVVNDYGGLLALVPTPISP